MTHVSVKICKSLNLSSKVEISQFARTEKTLTTAQKQRVGLLRFRSCSSTHLASLYGLTFSTFPTDKPSSGCSWWFPLHARARAHLVGQNCAHSQAHTHPPQARLGNISCRALVEEDNQQIHKIKSQLRRLSGNKQSQLEMQMSLKGSVSVDSRL